MTKNAQQALRYLLQNYSNNVRFCLICNYISKIDEGLQNEFIRLRFNQLPREDIIVFLKHISDTEKINMSYKSLSNIQKLYRSDIRSMINFIQSNQDIVKNHSENDDNLYIIDNDIWENLICKLTKREKLENIYAYVHLISLKYNIDKKNIIKDFLNYIIRNKTNIINSKFFNFVENLMHSQNLNNNHHIYYSLSQLSSFISSDTL
jgi:replication factor C subunit 3/5